MDFGSGLVLFSGFMTFGNEWYETHSINWRIPIATLLLTGAIGFVGRIDTRVANSFAVMIFIGAGATRFNGRSAFDTIASTVGSKTKGTNVRTA